MLKEPSFQQRVKVAAMGRRESLAHQRLPTPVPQSTLQSPTVPSAQPLLGCSHYDQLLCNECLGEPPFPSPLALVHASVFIPQLYYFSSPLVLGGVLPQHIVRYLSFQILILSLQLSHRRFQLFVTTQFLLVKGRCTKITKLTLTATTHV